MIFSSEIAAKSDGVFLSPLYQVLAFPVTFVIDEHGLSRQKILGSFAESDRDLGTLVSELLPAPHSAGQPHQEGHADVVLAKARRIT